MSSKQVICSTTERGKASEERSIMERDNIIDRKKYKALSECLHCTNIGCESETCKKAKKAGKYIN